MATPVQPYVQDLVFANNASTTLSGPVTSGNTLPVAAGTGQLFPSASGATAFVVTVISASNPTVFEIMLCTSRSGNVLTVQRAQEGTSRQTFAANDIVVSQWTAGQAATMLQQGQSPSFSPTSIVYFGIDTSSGPNTIVATTNPTFPNGYANGMLIEIQPAGANTSPEVTANINGAGFIPVINNDNSALLVEQILGGQRFLCTYAAGANALKMIAPPSVQAVTAVQFYLNASAGNDNNNGLSPGTAFQTINGAAQVINSNYQPNGPVTLNLANGLYAGASILGSSVSEWIISGNAGNPGAVGIVANGGTGSGNNYGCGLIVETAVVTVTDCAFVQGGQTSINENVFVGSGAQVNLVNCNFATPSAGASSSRASAIGVYGGSCNIYGNNSYNGLANNGFAFAAIGNTGSLVMGYSFLGAARSFALAISGGPSHSQGFIACNSNGSMAADANAVTFTGGSCTGHTIAVGGGGVISIIHGGNPPSPTFFPGTLGTLIDATTYGVYQGN